jgi:hypothetical protein
MKTYNTPYIKKYDKDGKLVNEITKEQPYHTMEPTEKFVKNRNINLKKIKINKHK